MNNINQKETKKDTTILVELSRLYYQLQNNIIDVNTANEMLKETTAELTELNESDSLEIISLKTEIKQKENLIVELFKDIESLKEKLNSIQEPDLFESDDNE